MTVLKHVGFEVPDWRELSQGPQIQPAYRDLVMATAPTAYWRLGETSGAMLDQVGSYPSVSIGAGVTRGVAGAIALDADKAVRFPGNATDFVSFGNVLASTFAGVSPFSVVAWVRNTAQPASRWQIITGRINNGGSLTRGINLFITPPETTRQLAFQRRGDSGSVNALTTAPALNTWSHVAATFDGVWMTAYLNGVPGTPVDGSGVSVGGTSYDASSLTIGGSHNNANFALTGDIDEVAVFGRALSAQEIATDFFIGVGQ